MSDQPRVLGDLFDIPEQVYANDYVVNLSELERTEVDKMVREYVVTEQLATQFAKGLDLIRSVLGSGRSEAAYVDGSFGSGKSYFLTVLAELLAGNPEARRKTELDEIIAEHDGWLRSKRFLQIKLNMIGAASLASKLFETYIRTVQELHSDAPFPALLREDGLIANARRLRERFGDEWLAEGLGGKDKWGGGLWTSEKLDAAFAAPHGDAARNELVSALLSTILSGYQQTVSGTDAYVPIDEGLSVMSRHAKDLGYDGIVLMLDELVLWLSGKISDSLVMQREAQSVSRLVESEDWPRPVPVISFVPRQRDLQDLVGGNVSGSESQTLFETLDHWKGRFNTLSLADQNLPEIVRKRLLTPKNEAAERAIAEAFAGVSRAGAQVRDVLLDAVGDSATMAEFEQSYPFSPVFLHVIVDVAEALQRQRSGIKLLTMLLGDHRDTLPVGRLMPVGAIFDRLSEGQDEYMSKQLKHDFDLVMQRYHRDLRPWLLARHGLTETDLEDRSANPAFAGDDLIVKTLMIAALTPGVPALRNPTVSQLLALNHGAIDAYLPGMDQRQVLGLLRDLAGAFGDVQVGPGDNPRVQVHIVDVDVRAIVERAQGHDNIGTQAALVNKLLWDEIGLGGLYEPDSTHTLKWRGTARTVEVQFGNVRSLPHPSFLPQPEHALRVLVDYPFDEGSHVPTEDEARIERAIAETGPNPPMTVAWIPAFLTDEEMQELQELNVIDWLLGRDQRFEEHAANLTSDERAQAKIQLESQRKALRSKVVESLKRAFGLAELRDPDTPRPSRQVYPLTGGFTEERPPAGMSFADAFEWIAARLLDGAYDRHPELDPDKTGAIVARADLKKVLEAVESAKLEGGRLELERRQVPVLRRIANPLEIAEVRENFVLRDEWRPRLNRKLKLRPDEATNVAAVRNALDELLPGLLPDVRDLLVRCYAIQDDRAWRRYGKPIDPPGIEDRLAGEMELAYRALPSPEEFTKAAERAEKIFGAARRPTRVYRAVEAIAAAVKQRVRETNVAMQRLGRLLDEHAETLGTGPGSPRRATVARLDALYADLGQTDEPTETLRLLAAADLPDSPVSARACVNAAPDLVRRLETAKWHVLDGLATGDAAMRGLAERLRVAAGEDDENVQPLAEELAEIEDEAIGLLAQNSRQAPEAVPDPEPETVPGPTPGRAPRPTGAPAPDRPLRVKADDAARTLGDLAKRITDEGGEWEVTYRRLG